MIHQPPRAAVASYIISSSVLGSLLLLFLSSSSSSSSLSSPHIYRIYQESLQLIHLHARLIPQSSDHTHIINPTTTPTMLHNQDGTPGSTPVWNPPPHLEARFSRKRRRNGTGTHSPCSQPLTNSSLATTRRQLLLDSRKSLLRQRAAHVEKVRRARANSHEAVGERLLALQQSLSQAQDSRNAILAKIAGSCANEVAKAKRLAQETRARREEEAKALKNGVEERMLEAARRRTEMLTERRGKRRERGSSSSRTRVDGCSDIEEGDASAALEKIRLSGTKSGEKSKEEAARSIQKVYRNYISREIVKRFLGLGLTIESVRDTSFEDISNLFQEEKVQKATARLLKLCGLLAAPATEGEVDVEVACRTFLSAYLILGHPAQVLSNDGENEKAGHSHSNSNH